MSVSSGAGGIPPRASPRREGGIEGKWRILNEEREDLKQKNHALEAQVAELTAKLNAFQDLPADDLRRAYALSQERVTDLADQLREVQQGTAVALLALSEDEKEAADALMTAYRIITERWKLKANVSELTSAVHTIQSFIQQHLLHRVAPEGWATWWFEERT